MSEEICVKKLSKNKVLPQIVTIFAVALSSLNCGLQFAWTSPTIPKLMANTSSVLMNIEQISYLTVVTPIGLIIGAPLFAFLSEYVGRKISVLFIAIPHILTWICIAVSNSLYVFYLARFLSGIADAGIYLAIPIYIGESVDKEVRGSWGNAISTSIYFGEFLINIIGSFCEIRTTALICLIVPLLHIAIFIFMAESPYYLIMKGDDNKAKTCLKKLRGSENVDNEYQEIYSDVKRQLSERGTLLDLFLIRTNFRALFIITGLRMIQQLSGFSAFIFYSQYLFQEAGGNISKETSSIAITALLAGCSIFMSFGMNRFGRKPLLIYSCAGCATALTILTIFFYLQDYTLVSVDSFTWVPLTGMLFYILMFASGLATVPTLMLSELFSASIKTKALCAMNFVYAILILVTSKLFQVLQTNHGLFPPFLLFSISCCLGIMFAFYFVPETKMKTLEEIQQDFRRKT